jgi:hypothetical protein
MRGCSCDTGDQFAGAELAVFELDAIPGSFPFTDNCGRLVHNTITLGASSDGSRFS